ncbi:IQ motif [Macleaya cordata]|uniref:IQ motif n=1 Tax=Macleaya cordata TaxID=56857 RepID=A0A200QF89_MACCD|nr:IQ motif [Macleaya cordata]
MGKSPGKWIKTILFGKKSSRSSLSKGRDASDHLVVNPPEKFWGKLGEWTCLVCSLEIHKLMLLLDTIWFYGAFTPCRILQVNVLTAEHNMKAANEKETRVAVKAPSADLVVSSPIISQPAPGTIDRNGGISVLETGMAPNLSCNEVVTLPRNQDAEKQGITASGQLNDLEKSRQEQAATKAQAAFRGYLARRAFRALRGIIRLQALVRGHLVRRQALATLRCMQGIVKLQALVRGQRVKLSDARLEVNKKSSLRKPLDAKRGDSTGVNTSTRREKPRVNAFISEFIGSSSKSMHLRLQYGPDEPNSAWVWLERWTTSRFWEPFLQPKKVIELKSQTRQGTSQNVATEPSRSRRVIRKAPVVNVDNGSTLSTSESEKPKRNLRKASAHHVDPVQEHPQNELEKVKRNLRKVSSSTVEPTDQPEVEIEKPKRSLRKSSNSSSPDIPNPTVGESAGKVKLVTTVAVTEQPDILVESEKPNHSMREVSSSPVPDIVEQGMVECAEPIKDTTAAVSRQPDVEPSMESLAVDGAVNVLHEDQSPVELPPLESSGKDENAPGTNVELISKEDQTSNENQKTSKRRASFPAKQENLENGLQNIPTLPSYMMATESAKAKLRGQGSPRFGHDGAEKNGFTRRHSLPSSTNGKMSSLSPRTQRVVQVNGKGGSKTDRSLLSSRDGNDKVVQAEWRR